MVELTIDILGFKTKTKYYAMEDGNIYSASYGGVLKYEITKDGYARVCIGRKHFLVHRLIAKAFIPNPENKKEINHINRDKLDNSVDNLEWVTREENVNFPPTYALRTAHIKCGEECNFSTLTNDNVIQIIKMINDGMTCKEIAQYFDVTPRSIRNIKNKKTWKNFSYLLKQ